MRRRSGRRAARRARRRDRYSVNQCVLKVSDARRRRGALPAYFHRVD